MSISNLLKEADRGGYVKIFGGVYFSSRENIISEQKGWADGDESKDKDFSGSPYWITTDNGADPIPISGEDDLGRFMEKYAS